jgi:hypothetical protein
MNTGSLILLLVASYDATWCNGLSPHSTRRSAFGLIGGACVGCIITSGAVAADTPEGVDVQNYIRTGMVSMPMGVSGQAGKSKPVTGVVLRYVWRRLFDYDWKENESSSFAPSFVEMAAR